jgi:hypothetical protein
MTNYAVTSYNLVGDYATVVAALETRIETIDNGKTIRAYTIVPYGNEYVGLLVYDT